MNVITKLIIEELGSTFVRVVKKEYLVKEEGNEVELPYPKARGFLNSEKGRRGLREFLTDYELDYDIIIKKWDSQK